MCEISVVLPVYNGEKHIAEAVGSVLQQTFRDWELIIVNDCSTDGTNGIINRYAEKDSRIRVIHNRINKKIPCSLNEGFRIARGKYLTWTSDDNIFLPEALEIMRGALECNPEAGMVYCDFDIIDVEGNKIRKNFLPEPNMLISGNCVGACFLYRKSVADKVGEYDASMFLAEDYDYWFRIYKEAKIVHIKKAPYLYRCHDGSLSATRLEEVRNQTSKLWLKYFDFIMKKMTKISDRYSFFDVICDYTADGERKEIEKFLYGRQPSYRLYRYKSRIHKKWKTLRKRLVQR